MNSADTDGSGAESESSFPLRRFLDFLQLRGSELNVILQLRLVVAENNNI